MTSWWYVTLRNITLQARCNPRIDLIHPFHVPQCNIQNRNVHISVLNGALRDMEPVHYGICEINPFMVAVRALVCFVVVR